MTTHATATFEVTSWEDQVYDDPSEGPKLGRATVGKTLRGDVEATSTAELLTCQAADGSAGYVASERVTGRIGDRAGTFVVQHGGTAVAGTPDHNFGHVVPGSGTGQLTGLRGTCEYRHDETGATFTLDYRFA